MEESQEEGWMACFCHVPLYWGILPSSPVAGSKIEQTKEGSEWTLGKRHGAVPSVDGEIWMGARAI